MSATPFFTVSETFNPGPRVPAGKTLICILPFDILSTFAANAFAPISIRGPPPQLVAILNLCLSAAIECEVITNEKAAINKNILFILLIIKVCTITNLKSISDISQIYKVMLYLLSFFYQG